MLMLLCTVHGYAVGPPAAWYGSQQMCACVQKALRPCQRRKVNCGLANMEKLFSRSQNPWQSGEWFGGREPQYIFPDLVIFCIGLAQFLVASFALDLRG